MGQSNRISPRWLGALTVLVVILSIALGARSYVRINWTDSLPRGLYLVGAVPREGVSRGEFVVACPPRSSAEIGLARHYLLAGECPGAVAPLLKLVAARAGDVVKLSPAGLSVNGVPLPHTALLGSDQHGDPPAHVAFGTYRVAAGEVWLFTSKNNGYDSRYFGAVSTSSILNIAHPLLTAL